jgi:hypothetical protein
MALPTLDATFASVADQPRRMMLAKWLVEELGETQAPSSVLVSGAGSLSVNGIYVYDGTYNGKGKWRLSEFVYLHSEDLGDGPSWYIYDDNIGRMYGLISDTEYPWQGTYVSGFDGELPAPTAIEVPAASPISNYHDLPERYLWAKIAVAAGGPKTEADYISLPKNYAWSDIYNTVSGDVAQSTVVVSGAASANGSYAYVGLEGGRPKYELNINFSISWDSGNSKWTILADGNVVTSSSNVSYPWLATGWIGDFSTTDLALTPQTPNHTDWSENVALGHIAAAYRGDTANPANLATYIDWPWRYKVASIIDHLS